MNLSGPLSVDPDTPVALPPVRDSMPPKSIFDGLQGDPVGAHRLYINLRNKQRAHSVNPFEQMEVGVILSPVKSAEKEVLGVATLSMRLISHDVEGIRQLGTLAKVVMEKVSKLAKDYEQK